MTHSTKKRQSEEKETVKTAKRIKYWVVNSIPMICFIFTVINIVMFAIKLRETEGLNKDNKQVNIPADSQGSMTSGALVFAQLEPRVLHKENIHTSYMWGFTKDVSYIKESVVTYDNRSHKFKYKEYGTYGITVKLDYCIDCKRNSQTKIHTAMFCLVRETATLGQCHALGCCNGANVIDKTKKSTICPSKGGILHESIIMTASPRLSRGDSIFTVSSNVTLLHGTFSVYKH